MHNRLLVLCRAGRHDKEREATSSLVSGTVNALFLFRSLRSTTSRAAMVGGCQDSLCGRRGAFDETCLPACTLGNLRNVGRFTGLESDRETSVNERGEEIDTDRLFYCCVLVRAPK